MANLILDWAEDMRILMPLVPVLLLICVYIYEANARKRDIQKGFERLEHEIEGKKEVRNK